MRVKPTENKSKLQLVRLLGANYWQHQDPRVDSLTHRWYKSAKVQWNRNIFSRPGTDQKLYRPKNTWVTIRDPSEMLVDRQSVVFQSSNQLGEVV